MEFESFFQVAQRLLPGLALADHIDLEALETYQSLSRQTVAANGRAMALFFHRAIRAGDYGG